MNPLSAFLLGVAATLVCSAIAGLLIMAWVSRTERRWDTTKGHDHIRFGQP